MQKWVLAEDVGIETVGDVFTPLLKKGTPIPCSAKEVFSTAEDGQSAVTLKLAQGGGTNASKNRQLGKFDLTDIPPAAKGVPQIEVVFEVDEAGNLSVEAKDLASLSRKDLRVEAATEHRVKLTASSGSLAEDIRFTVSGGPAETVFESGTALPAAKPLVVTTTEPDQELFPVTFMDGSGATLARTTLRLKGVKGPAGRKLALHMELSISKDGVLELRRRDKDGAPGDRLLKSDRKVSLNGGDAGFADIFKEIFGTGPKPKTKTNDSPGQQTEPKRSDDAQPLDRIFISHASADANLANDLLDRLEGRAGQSCWIAPRNVRSGYDYRSEILEGIKSCGHFVVLLSEHSNASAHVLREVSLADQYSKRIVVVRTDNAVLRPELEYLLHGLHWVTWQDVQSSIERIL